MTKREIALEWIKVSVAQEGKMTDLAFRKYIENRISYAAFMDAARRGMAIFEATKKRQMNLNGGGHTQEGKPNAD